MSTFNCNYFLHMNVEDISKVNTLFVKRNTWTVQFVSYSLIFIFLLSIFCIVMLRFVDTYLWFCFFVTCCATLFMWFYLWSEVKTLVSVSSNLFLFFRFVFEAEGGLCQLYFLFEFNVFIQNKFAQHPPGRGSVYWSILDFPHSLYLSQYFKVLLFRVRTFMVTV